MKEGEQHDLDFDVVNLVKNEITEPNDSVLYIRSKSNGVFVYFNGTAETLVNAIISAMNDKSELYDVLSASVDLYESDSIQVEESNVFDSYELMCAAIITLFEEKHQVKFTGYENGLVGGRAVFGKDAINFTDVLYDLKSEQPQNVIWWFQETDNTDYVKFCNWIENNTHYCGSCNSVVGFDDSDWMNDTPMCPYCGGKLEL